MNANTPKENTNSAPTPKQEGDKSNQGNGAPSNPTLNTQSSKPVAPGATTKSDPDNTASKAAATDAKPGTSTDAAAQAIENKARASELAGTPENEKLRLEREAEFEKARLEKDGTLSAQEQRDIDAAMGDAAEDPEADHRYLHADPHSSKDSIEKDMKVIRERDKGIHGRLEHFVENYKHPHELITQLVRDVPEDTPDEHIVWGASGHTLRFGHLRALVMGTARKSG